MSNPSKFGYSAEKSMCKEGGFKRVPQSGSQWHSPGDGVDDNFMIDMKATKSQQYILKWKDIKNIEDLAIKCGKTGLMGLNICGKSYALIPFQLIEFLRKGLEE